MNNRSEKLSLKLPPEVAEIMPWIVSAKASGNPKLVAWAKREYETAQEKARWREHYERKAEERRLRQAYELQLVEEEQEREFLAWRQGQEQQQARLAGLGAHFALEEGQEEFQPTQSSQKGWRRLLSECTDLCWSKRYSEWGTSGYHSNHHKRNCGRTNPKKFRNN